MRKIIIATIILCSMFLTGCGSADVYDKLYLKTLYITENSDCSARMEFFGDNSQDITAHGSSFEKVRENARISGGKDVFMGHCEVIVLDSVKDPAKVLTKLLNEWRIPPSCYVVCGKDLTTSQYSINVLTIKSAVEQGKAPECDMVTVLGELLGDKKSAYVAEFTADGGFRLVTVS